MSEIENIRRKSDYMAIADQYFSEIEKKDLFALPVEEQRSRFYDYWTLKEAYIKACGIGMSLGLSKFSFSLDNGASPEIEFYSGLTDDANDWLFWRTTIEED